VLQSGQWAKLSLTQQRHWPRISCEANKVTQATAQRPQAQQLARRPPDYDARVQQGIALLEHAKTASPEEIAQMQIQAAEILQSLDPDAAKLAK
jgi:hypothetical protein